MKTRLHNTPVEKYELYAYKYALELVAISFPILRRILVIASQCVNKLS